MDAVRISFAKRISLPALAVVLTTYAMATNAEPLAISTSRVPLAPEEPTRQTAGVLEYRGGIRLTSPDDRFGGLSGLRISTDASRFIAVSDGGWWVTGSLIFDESGWLRGVERAEIQPLTGEEGLPLKGKAWTDAESVEFTGSGLLVSFERRHRIWRYPGGNFAIPSVDAQAIPTPSPPELSQAPDNGGLEAIVVLDDHNLLAITEKFATDGGYRGWIVDHRRGHF